MSNAACSAYSLRSLIQTKTIFNSKMAAETACRVVNTDTLEPWIRILSKGTTERLQKIKAKLSRYRPEQAHGRSGRLRPRIFLTFGTRRW
jgi:hypothetical protein